jgi:hypothetical protein
MLCVSTPPSGNIGFDNVERQSRNSLPIAHTSHTVNLECTLNFQRRSDTNNSVCRLFNQQLHVDNPPRRARRRGFPKSILLIIIYPAQEVTPRGSHTNCMHILKKLKRKHGEGNLRI